MEAEICKDGTECLNGSTCIPFERGYKALNPKSPTGIRSYKCDCSQTLGTHFYAGYECEYEANDYCLLGEAVATKLSFCARGSCVEIYQPDKGEIPIHVGCECKDGYEGDFCEYVNGNAPVKVTHVGTITMLSVAFTALFIIGGAIRLRKKRVQQARSRGIPVESSIADVEI